MKLDIRFDRQSASSLRRQIYVEIRQLITNGVLPPGQHLPSTRSLAQTHGISRSTVTAIYERLIKEGYINCVLGSGTYVNRTLPHQNVAATVEIEETVSLTTAKNHSLSDIARRILSDQQSTDESVKTVRFNFARFDPVNARSFSGEWRKLWLHNWNSCSEHGQDVDSMGNRHLQEVLFQFLQETRAVHSSPDNIAILPNIRVAQDLIARMFINPGDEIVVEDPSENAAWSAAEAYGAKVHSVPVDDCGMNVEALLLEAPAAVKLVYASPAHQFPTGSVLSYARRRALVEWANRRAAFIVEDDADSDLRFSPPPLPSIHGLSSKNESVIYIGTFAKILSPAMSIAFVVLPDCLVSAFSQLLKSCAGEVSRVDQLTLADFIGSGLLESHLLQARTALKRKRDVLVKALMNNLGQRAVIFGDDGGQFLMVRFRTAMGAEELAARAHQASIKLLSTAQYYRHADAPAGEFVLGYGAMNESEIREAVAKLTEVVRSKGVFVPSVTQRSAHAPSRGF